MVGMLGDKVGIIPIFDPDKSPGGIWIPEQAKERCDQGIVKYLGPDCNILKLGDYVIFPGYTGQTVRIDNEILILMSEDAVVAVIEGEDLDETEVPGLYFKGKDGMYFQANVEFSVDLINKAVGVATWRTGMKSKDMVDHRPGAVHG